MDGKREGVVKGRGMVKGRMDGKGKGMVKGRDGW